MAEQPSDARIRDLKRRLELNPTSRLFVSLAEEYRKAGRVADALVTLQQGLRNHPGYISAQVALARAYLEAGNVSEAIAMFSKVLTADPGNLLSAKSLADIFLSRGESVEAIKKYKLYGALSGDRKVDDIIVRLEKEIAPPAPGTASAGDMPTQPFKIDTIPAPLPLLLLPPPPLPDLRAPAAAPPAPEASAPFLVGAGAEEPAVAGQTPQDEVFGDGGVFPSERPTDKMEAPAAPPAESSTEAPGRALADLYYAQGHTTEALRIYDELAAANPFDTELKRLRRDAEARLLPAGQSAEAATADAGLQRRLARIRALKGWLSVVQAG
ncbi:MAG: tetratricopeptide repeat protein [Thermoanaerobaculia bacterium]